MSKKSKVEISVGDRIGAVQVIGRVFNVERKEWEYVCRCRCGNEFRTRKDHLLKPRMGCRACINKVKADIDLAGTITEAEYNRVVEAKNFAKKEKRALEEREKVARAEKRAADRAKREKEIAYKKQKFKERRLASSIWIGQKFNKLTVIDIYVDSGKTYWICQCECGNIVTKLAKSVKFGHFISCGCRARQISENKVCNERLHGIWNGMKDRCKNPNSPNYRNYGGRGITVCQEWDLSYKNFRDWAYNNGWTEEIPDDHKMSLSIERIDVNGNYCPKNCCFIPLYKQCLNKRPYSELPRKQTAKDKTVITIDGVQKSLREWQIIYGVSDEMLRYRVKKLNMPIEKALSTPKFDWLKKSK